MRIETDDLSRSAVHGMLVEHLRDMHASSPAESIHALDLTGLRVPEVTAWTAWEGETLLGSAALKELTALAGEIKSMRTTAPARGRGVASVLLTHVVQVARERGYARLSLETGTQDFFAPARRLYARHGFLACAPFADYAEDPNSRFLTLEL